jgi:hypothetical protein
MYASTFSPLTETWAAASRVASKARTKGATVQGGYFFVGYFFVGFDS